MPSLFTSNGGIELPSDGEQDGVWGDTVNTNMQIIDRLTNGVGAITLSGTTHTLTTLNGTPSDGHYAVVVFGGTPSGTNTVTVAPNEAEKVYFVRNTTAQSIVLTQGSGGDVTVTAGAGAIVYADGAGTGAAVVDFTGTFAVSLASLGVTATAAELNILDGATVTPAELNILDGVTASTAELNILDGVTASTAELNILDGVTATTAELNILAGVTASTAELNILDGVTATTAELNILDGATLTTAELNTLDGVTLVLADVAATAAELNILDGATVTTAELNILDGATVTTAELNILDGVTATATELNTLDGITGVASQVEAEAGTDNTKLMTPLRTTQAIAAIPAPSAPTTSQVLTATAGASVGEIGTYALLKSAGFSDISPGATTAGSGLRYSTAGGTISTTPSGTWRCMGFVDISGGNPDDTTLFLRIS